MICSHSLLIIIHLILVAVIFAPPEGHLEHRFSVPTGSKANALQISIVVISQLFNVVSAISSARSDLNQQSVVHRSSWLVSLFQQLALRRVFHGRQTLTSIHDSHSAWGGLGSAFVTLYLQRKQATSRFEPSESLRDNVLAGNGCSSRHHALFVLLGYI